MKEMISLWSFIDHSSWVVQCVLAVLVLSSVLSWTVIIQRGLLLRRTKHAADVFQKLFQSETSLSQLNKKITPECGDLGLIFQVGFSEYTKWSHAETIPELSIMLECTERAMRLCAQKQIHALEHNVSVLATIGSTAPYVGLLGTVWGILSSFQTLGSMQQVTLSMVAPGISEALIATAVGLFVAIPAVVFYNRFANTLSVVVEQYAMFQETALGIVQRKLVFLNRSIKPK